MCSEFVGPLALGILIGAVAVLTAVYFGVEIVAIPSRKGEIMKDCFDKPIKVVNVCNVRPGDFIHDISYPSLIDSEKRKGYVVYARRIEQGQIVLRLNGRKTLLEVPVDANAVITRTPRLAQALPVKNEHQASSNE